MKYSKFTKLEKSLYKNIPHNQKKYFTKLEFFNFLQQLYNLEISISQNNKQFFITHNLKSYHSPYSNYLYKLFETTNNPFEISTYNFENSNTQQLIF